MAIENRISEEALDILQEDSIFLVGWPQNIFDAEIRRIQRAVENAPPEQQKSVNITVTCARNL